MALEYDKEVRFSCALEVFTTTEISGIQAVMSC